MAAVDELLADKLTVLQWWEENRDYPAEDFFAIRGGGEAFHYYQLPDGRLVGLWKKSRVSISEDGGKNWAPVKISPSLVMSGGKIWGERTPEGRYALCYNPNTDSCTAGPWRWSPARMALFFGTCCASTGKRRPSGIGDSGGTAAPTTSAGWKPGPWRRMAPCASPIR